MGEIDTPKDQIRIDELESVNDLYEYKRVMTPDGACAGDIDQIDPDSGTFWIKWDNGGSDHYQFGEIDLLVSEKINHDGGPMASRMIEEVFKDVRSKTRFAGSGDKE